MTAKINWDKALEDPVQLAGGGALVTLRDAADYIGALPRKEVESPHWQTAIEVLIMAAEGRGPLMFARVGMIRALNHGWPAPEKPPRRKAVKVYKVIR